jgi:hypothetical protein
LRRAVVVTSVVVGAFVAVMSACSLGLDESKIGAGLHDASIGPNEDAPATSDDAGDAGAVDTGPPGCVHDTDCTSTNACRIGTCSDAGACVYDVCPTGACQGSSCTTTGTTSACSAPATYGFHASSITVSAGAVGCNGNASVCLAASYPFAFVGTTEGVVAYAVNDPSNSSPPPVPVLGVPFVPSAITAMGSRVYFLGGVAGSGPTWRAQLAWVDVPSDPLVPSLQARSAFDTTIESAVSSAWAATDGSLFLVDQSTTLNFPIAEIKAPLKDNDTLGFFPSADVPVGAAPVIASGDRVVVWRNDPVAYTTYFSFETNPATLNANNSGEQSTLIGADGGVSMGPTAGQSTYAQGADGSVLWNGASIVIVDGGTPALATTRMAWLVADGTTTTFDPSTNIDVEVYATPQPLGTPLVGPIAWIDANTALVLAAAHELPSETSVQVAVKTPTAALAQGRRTIVPVGVGSVGAAASNGYGYVLESDSTGTLELHVFAPACAM